MSERVRRLKRLGLAVAFVACLAGAQYASARTPYSDAEIRSVETSDETKIRALRKEEVNQLRIALGRHSPTSRRADLYLRLAEIHMEAYHMDYVLEGRVHEKRLEKGVADPTIEHSHSRPHLDAGIKACKEILSYRIPYDKLDEVYYFLGFNHAELGDRATGVSYFNQLTQRFPGSKYVGEAYKEMGDAAFDEGDFRKAQALFETSARKSTPDILPRVYHRLAWSYYRTKQYDRAVATMKLAIESAQKSGEKFLNLREEALRDMALFMTETGKVDEAIAYFDASVADKKFYPEVLEKLGKQFERNVEPAKATLVYESLLKTNPSSEPAFRVRVKLVDLDLRRGRYKEALVRIDPAQGFKVPKGGEAETQTAAQNLRAMIRRTATEHHEKFRKTDNRAELEIAENYYTAYLTTFLSQEDPRGEKPEIQMYLAEVKREAGKSKEASALYRQVLESKDKRYAKEAGALWTASLSEAIRKTIKPGAGQGKAADPSPLEVEFVDAADRMQEALGETNEGREAALRAAEVLGGYKNTHKDAIKRSRKIIERWPSSPQAVTAAYLWVQIVNEDDPDELGDVMKQLRGNADLLTADQRNGGKLKAQILDQDARLRIAAINKQEKKSDFGAAGKEYEAFGNDATTRDGAEKAYNNSISSYLKVSDADAIERVSSTWAKRFHKSPMLIDSLRHSATHFLVAGNFEVAGRTFERLGHEAGDADALETAGRVYEGAGDAAGAQATRLSYLEMYPKSPHRGVVALALARSLDGAHKDVQAVTAYKLCMSASQDLYAECGARLGDLYIRSKDVPSAKAAYRKVAASRSTASKKSKKAAKPAAPVASGPQSPFVAYARYRLAVLLEQEAKFDRLEMPEAKLKKALNERLNFLEPLSRAYTSAVDAGGPWAIAALDRLANWATGFADDVDAIPPPPGADPAQFKKNLGSVSIPLRRKATSTWAEAYSKALSSETLSPALPEIADHIADAGSSAIPARAQGFRGRFRLAGVPADGGEAGRAKALETVREKLKRNVQDAPAWVDYGNLLWGEGKPLLARIAYERALGINSRNAAALNNRGVVLVSSEGEEDWQGALEASLLFRDALRQDEFYLAAKMNLGLLLNYYRLFERAKPAWDQVHVKYPDPDVQDGMGVVQQGLAQGERAKSYFASGTQGGLPKSRFALVYHEAALLAAKGAGESCVSRLDDMDIAALVGFEKDAALRLKRTCSGMKGVGK